MTQAWTWLARSIRDRPGLRTAQTFDYNGTGPIRVSTDDGLEALSRLNWIRIMHMSERAAGDRIPGDWSRQNHHRRPACEILHRTVCEAIERRHSGAEEGANSAGAIEMSSDGAGIYKYSRTTHADMSAFSVYHMLI